MLRSDTLSNGKRRGLFFEDVAEANVRWSRCAHLHKAIRQHLTGATFWLIGIAKNVAYHDAAAFYTKQGTCARKPMPIGLVTIGVWADRWLC